MIVRTSSPSKARFYPTTEGERANRAGIAERFSITEEAFRARQHVGWRSLNYKSLTALPMDIPKEDFRGGRTPAGCQHGQEQTFLVSEAADALKVEEFDGEYGTADKLRWDEERVQRILGDSPLRWMKNRAIFFGVPKLKAEPATSPAGRQVHTYDASTVRLVEEKLIEVAGGRYTDPDGVTWIYWKLVLRMLGLKNEWTLWRWRKKGCPFLPRVAFQGKQFPFVGVCRKLRVGADRKSKVRKRLVKDYRRQHPGTWYREHQVLQVKAAMERISEWHSGEADDPLLPVTKAARFVGVVKGTIYRCEKPGSVPSLPDKRLKPEPFRERGDVYGRKVKGYRKSHLEIVKGLIDPNTGRLRQQTESDAPIVYEEEPRTPQLDEPLTETEQHIIEAAREYGPVKGVELATAADYPFNSYFRMIVGKLVKKGLLHKTPAGYRV